MLSFSADINQNDWDKFVASSDNGTIFHSFQFLNYHKKKFENVQIVGVKENSSIVCGIVYNFDGSHIRSPFGASYGGFVFDKRRGYKTIRDCISLILEFLREKYPGQILKIVQSPCYISEKMSSVVDYVLLESGFRTVNSDATAVILTQENLKYKGMTIRNLKKLPKSNRSFDIELCHNGNQDKFWKVLEKTFKKHGTISTHTLEEWQYLVDHNPTSIFSSVLSVEDEPVAGLGVIKLNDTSMMTFYICSDSEYNDLQPTSYLLDKQIDFCRQNNIKFFDLGTCSVSMVSRPNIFEFKEGFDSTIYLRNTYEFKV